MSKIALSDNTFEIVPEGTHVFKITAVNYKETFGKIEITMKTEQGLTHIERYSFVKNNGERNDVAVGIFSHFAKVALQNYERKSIDHEELVGRFIKAEVTHVESQSKKDPTKTVTYSRLGNKYEADGFDGDDTEKASDTKKGKVDLSSLLG